MKAEFLSTPEHRELANLLLGRAHADLSAARLLADHPDQDDGVIGFHIQQACEKSLKAVIAIRQIEVPRVHDLEALVEVLEGHEIRLPADLNEVGALTAWAVTMRYDEPDKPLDREVGLALADGAIRWAESEVDG